MQITVADVQKISLKDGETLVVFVDISNRPRPVAEQALKDAAMFMRKAITNQSVQVIAVPQGHYTFGVIGANGATNQATPTLTGKSTSSGTADDAWDRAMKGLG